MIPGQADPTASWRGRAAALLLVLAAIGAGPRPARSQSDFPNIPVWSYPGAYHAGVGADTVATRPRTITVRWVRDAAAEARPNFGGYRIYRATNINGICDTASMVLMRRFSRQVQDSVFAWHFPPINGSTPLADRIVSFIDPDSAGRFVKIKRPPDDPCRPRCFDSLIVLIPPPGPHDGFRTWYSVTYERINTAFNDLEDMFVPGPIEHRFDLSTAQSPVAIATGDLDGDGLADLVTANQDANSITIRLGQAPPFCGQAGFGPPHEVPVGQGPRGVAIGDLDLDGVQDVVVANGGDHTVSVFRGLGRGSFVPAVTTPLNGAPVSLALGDLNSDGALDVAVAIANPPSIQMLFGDGTGALAPPTSVPGTLVSSVTPDALVIGDLDNDRKTDIVIASISGRAGRWMGTGEGAFGPQATFLAGPGARALVVGDITGDFKSDLVVANGLGNTVSVWSGRGPNGNGTFRSLGTFAVGKGPASVSLIDIDANNHPDIAVANADGGDVTVLTNTIVDDSTATFANPLTLPVGGQPVFILTGNFNREGTPDLAVADSIGSSVNVTFGPSNRNHKGANVANDVYEPTSDPNAPPDSQFFAHPTAPTGGVTANLSRVGVVPNPYRAIEAWNPEGGHELHFINLPREARILIYTVSGDLVKEIHHNVPPYTPGAPQPPSSPPYDQNRDYEAWDLKNGAGKDVVSGIYIYRVEASSFQFQSRFIVIR